MEPRVITITSGKGGVGKTTITANLATALAMAGHQVVAVDADIGLRNLDVMMGLENRIVYDLVDVAEGRCRLRQALIRDKRLSNLFLLPAAQTKDKTAVQPADMVKICEELRSEFSFVLVDSPAGIEHGFRTALAPADEVIVVTTPEVAAVRDADRVIGLVEAAGKELVELAINRVKPEMVERGDMLSVEDVLEILAIPLIGVIPEDPEVIVATNKGVPVVLNNLSPSGQAIKDMARRLLGEEVPFPTLRGKESFFNLFSRWLRRK